MGQRWKLKLVACALLPAIVTGCRRGPPSIKIPSYDPPRVAQRAIDAMDANGDQLLSREELASSPGLLAILRTADQDGDEQLSAAEIEQRVAGYAQLGMGAQSVMCKVTLRGRPLVGVEVSFVPEDCLADILQAGKGRTRRDGSASLVTENRVPGLSPGLYRVVISMMENGEETIPAKYNTETELGYEVSAHSATAQFDLN